MVNYLAVLVAGIASVVVGFLWYGPLFGRTWMKLMNFSSKDMDDAKKKGMAKKYVIMIINTLVMTYILALFLDFTSAVTLSRGILIAFLIWLGFIATITLGSVLWEGKSVKLYFINVIYNLVSIIISGIILTLWR